MSEIRLTEAERDELALACDAGCGFGDAWVRGIRSGLEDMLLPSVEAILAVRLAAVEALDDTVCDALMAAKHSRYDGLPATPGVASEGGAG